MTRGLALMLFRDTVISATGQSPTQLLIGRHVKTNLPTPSSALRSYQSSPEDIRENDNKAKLSYARHYDRRQGARSLPSISPGDEVMVKTPLQSDWSQKYVVSTPADTPRSFVVQTRSGGVYRRNRRHLQATDASSESTIPPIFTRFNKIAIQGTPQMAVDKEALICLSRVYSYYFKCNVPLFYVYPALTRYLSILFLNILTLLACTHSSDNLFHTLMVLCENENFLTSNLLCFFTRVKLCPLVILLS